MLLASPSSPNVARNANRSGEEVIPIPCRRVVMQPGITTLSSPTAMNSWGSNRISSSST